MSVQMAAARAFVRATMKPIGASEVLGRMVDRRVSDPPAAVARDHTVEAEVVEGTRCVWLDQERRHAGTIVYLHGGSYVSGPLTPQWTWFAALCADAGAAGLLVDYPLAPERAYPDALERTVAIALSLVGERWLLAGDSAGGGLALATAFRLRDGGHELPCGLLLVSPWLDLTMSDPEARGMHRRDPMLTLRGLRRAAVSYAGSADPRDPHLSPLNGDPASLPPQQVEVGTAEMFWPDNRTWGERCREAGADCDLVVTEGGFHDFPLGETFIPETRAARERQVRFARERLAA